MFALWRNRENKRNKVKFKSRNKGGCDERMNDWLCVCVCVCDNENTKQCMYTKRGFIQMKYLFVLLCAEM